LCLLDLVWRHAGIFGLEGRILFRFASSRLFQKLTGIDEKRLSRRFFSRSRGRIDVVVKMVEQLDSLFSM